jgi:hypothetical protein
VIQYLLTFLCFVWKDLVIGLRMLYLLAIGFPIVLAGDSPKMSSYVLCWWFDPCSWSFPLRSIVLHIFSKNFVRFRSRELIFRSLKSFSPRIFQIIKIFLLANPLVSILRVFLGAPMLHQQISRNLFSFLLNKMRKKLSFASRFSFAQSFFISRLCHQVLF